MSRGRLFRTLSVSLLALMLTVSVHLSFAIDSTLSPPPTPHYMLTVPRINEIVYMINITNVNASWITLDFALPKTWAPDTFVTVKEDGIEIVGNATFMQNYADRENNRTGIYVKDFGPNDSVNVNITFYSLKYKLDYSTHQPMIALGYPSEYDIYTQPENHIESNDSMIVNKALALVGNRTNPFRIAEQIYDFTLSYVTYKRQDGIRGALWALQNGTGDCTEFGSLFVALMRAVGIPARTVIGHVARELSVGGVAKTSSLGWVDSPHLWAEFYVEGYGWVPADPTFGRKDPEKHFGTTWADYLPLMKGSTMNDKTDSLVYIRYPAETKIEYSSQLLVTPLASLPFNDKALQDFMTANEQSNLARRVAYRAYNCAFNVNDTYPFLERTFASLINATKAMSDANSSLSREYSLSALSDANRTLNMISSIVINEAQMSTAQAWKEFRILGALSGENYLRMARDSQDDGNYLNVVQNAYFARASAEQAPSILLFLGPVGLCFLTVAMIWQKNRKAKTPRKPTTTIQS